MQILDAIRRHAGLAQTQPFTIEQLSSVDGFRGHASHVLSADESAAVAALRAHFAAPAADLQALLARFELDEYIRDGLAAEV